MTKPSEIRAALDAATPGPWTTGDLGAPYHLGHYAVIGGGRVVAGLNSNFPPEANASLIAAAPGWLRELLDRQERMAALLWKAYSVGSWCPGCGRTEEHTPGCDLAAVLREVGE